MQESDTQLRWFKSASHNVRRKTIMLTQENRTTTPDTVRTQTQQAKNLLLNIF